MKTEKEYQYKRYEDIILNWSSCHKHNSLTFPIALDRCDKEVIEMLSEKYQLRIDIREVNETFGTATVKYPFTTESLLKELGI